jgi:hypothetical protein
MHSNLSYRLAQANQQELLRRAELSRLAGELPRRQSRVMRVLRATPLPSLSRRPAADLPQAAQAATPSR